MRVSGGFYPTFGRVPANRVPQVGFGYTLKKG